MNDQKTRFYKRWWFVLPVGMVLGAGVLIAAVFFIANRQNMHLNLPWSQARSNCFTDGQTGKVVCISKKEITPTGSTVPLYLELRESDSKGDFVPTGLDSKYLLAVEITNTSANPPAGQPFLVLHFNDEGGKLIEAITARNIGKPVAVFVNGKQMFPAPIVTGKISGRDMVLGGNMSLELMESVARGLNAGVGLTQISQ